MKESYERPYDGRFQLNQIVRTLGPQQFHIGRIVQIYEKPDLHNFGQINIFVRVQELGVRTFEGDNLHDPNNLPYPLSYRHESLTEYDPSIFPAYFGPKRLNPVKYYNLTKPDIDPNAPIDPNLYENPTTFAKELKKYGPSILL